MSTNPFRRSSLKDAATSGLTSRGAVEVGADVVPLTVNTKVPGSSQKHVVFASPPGIPISPISYPPSPEDTRISPTLFSAQPVANQNIGYATALQIDPFGAENYREADDAVITQAQQNAKRNSEIVNETDNLHPRPNEDAVKNTLSRFASAPRRNFEAQVTLPEESSATTPVKRGMDVDAFKRLLLTGQSERVSSTQDHGQPSGVSQPSRSSDTGSMAETASNSQQSLFDSAQSAQEDTPRSSTEINRSDTQETHNQTDLVQTPNSKKRPPPPKPRYGKRIISEEEREIHSVPLELKTDANEASLGTDSVEQGRAVSYDIEGQSDSSNVVHPTPSSGTTKKPPPPPLSRRKSKHTSANTAPRTPSGQRISSTEQTGGSSTVSGTTPGRVPQPPPPRRPNSIYIRRPSDTSQIIDENEVAAIDQAPSTATDDLQPSLPSSRKSSASKRASQGLMSPPPLPPPRRNRASSRSSIDSQRPVIAGAAAAAADGTQDESEVQQPGIENRSSSGGINMGDMLADLAALQKEVDAARAKGFR